MVGFVTLREHNFVSLELSCIALLPSWHRAGLGRRLCVTAEKWWAGRGGGLVQVKTVGASRANEHYARTRAFYDAIGYLPVEEFPDLWPGIPCLLLVKPLDQSPVSIKNNPPSPSASGKRAGMSKGPRVGSD